MSVRRGAYMSSCVMAALVAATRFSCDKMTPLGLLSSLAPTEASREKQMVAIVSGLGGVTWVIEL